MRVKRWTRREAIGVVAGAGASLILRPSWGAPGSPLGRREIYYGADKPSARQIALRAGPLDMVLEPELAFLRYIRRGEVEFIRGIFSPVRDRNWGTVSPRVSRLRVETAGDGFQVSFDVNCVEDPIDFFWKGTITGEGTGAVQFRMEGEARSTFLRNRIGFCILHPITECAGEPCVVETVDGSTQAGKFPDFISPHQPFMNMRAISHGGDNGVEVRFEGEVFEMEDQRNWTDASYKTYCTPLELPFPVEVKKGTRIAQAVTVRAKGKARPAVRAASPEVTIEVDRTRRVTVPSVGFGVAAEEEPLRAVDRVRQLRPAHLRVDLKLGEPGYRDLLRRASAEAASVGASLEAAVFVTDAADEELRGLAALKPKVARWLVMHADKKSTGERWVRLARKYLRGKVGGGTNANFTELNRERPPEGLMDVVCYSASPQVHAFDNRSLAETFEGLRHTVRTARQFIGDADLAVTPVTLKPRFNPVATAAESTVGGKLPSSVDPRQMSLFGAAWTLGSLQALIESGVESLTYYETHGWRGLMSGGRPMPDQFPDAPGVFPLYHVFRDLAEFAGGEVAMTKSSRPLDVVAMTLHKQSWSRLMMANLGGEVQHVRVADSPVGSSVRIHRMDEHNAMEAMRDPERYRGGSGKRVAFPSHPIEVTLLPYSYARIDPASRS
ncbi:MAG: hypothetical protein GY953_29000 [bacterium]|nr:hypothetical protein [bacterium]